MLIQFIWVHAFLIRQSDNIEMNPGPKLNPCHSFSICHWNLNSLAAHNYLKVSPLRAYVAIKKFDVVCLSETYLDSVAHRNPYLIVVLGDFNAQTKRWYTLGKTTYESTRIDRITSQFGMEKLLHELAHITGYKSSCIDLTFASLPDLVVDSGVQSSLHQNCHHQIVFARLNLKVFFPPRYEREVSHLKKQILTIL